MSQAQHIAGEWPYPVKYGEENEVESDVLVLGGGIAGCHAAINAAKRGAKVTVVEKASHDDGAATVDPVCDHWHGAMTNPCSKITPEEMMELGKRRSTSTCSLNTGTGSRATSCSRRARTLSSTWRNGGSPSGT